MRFYSDNTATACPEVLDAIRAANVGLAKAYGEDQWTRRLDVTFSEFFGADVHAFAVATGTAANSLSLATICPPYGAVFAHDEAHIVRDECGAPEFFSGGARVVTIAGAHGKLTTAALRTALDANPTSVHSLQPAAVSLTQATELGTVYRPNELYALCALAHERGLKVHLDGARIANALAFLACQPADVTWRAGVDVLSFGATKNGALTAEAVVFFDRSLVRDFELRRKRAGHLLSKSRYVSVQLLAYIETGVWQRNAQRANSLARRIAAAAGDALLHPLEANEIFVRLGDAGKSRLRAQGFEFYDWGPAASGEARFVVSWDQEDGDVAALCAALHALREPKAEG
ncbi:MAG: threonine aldolase family protein [Gammaproteobacteria bacterium]